MNCVFCSNAIQSVYYCYHCQAYWLDNKVNECHSCHEFNAITSCEICDSCNVEYPEYADISLIIFYFNKDLSIRVWSPRTLFDKEHYVGTYTFDDNMLSIGNLRSSIVEPHKVLIKPKSSEELFSYSKKLLKLGEYL